MSNTAASARAVLTGSVLSLFVQPPGWAPLGIEIEVGGKSEDQVLGEARDKCASPDWKHLDMDAIQGCVRTVVQDVLAKKSQGDEPEGGYRAEIGDFEPEAKVSSEETVGDEPVVDEPVEPTEPSAPGEAGSGGEPENVTPPGDEPGAASATTSEEAAGAGGGGEGSAPSGSGDGSGSGDPGTQSGG